MLQQVWGTSMGTFVETFEKVKKGGGDIKREVVSDFFHLAQRISADILQLSTFMRKEVVLCWDPHVLHIDVLVV